jgi:hypothetical protein
MPAPHVPGEHRCAACCGTHIVYMSFMLRNDWCCQFLEKDLKTPLPRKVVLKDADEILQIAVRGAARMDTEKRQAFDYAIEMGRGGVRLGLTEEQYQRLRLPEAKQR